MQKDISKIIRDKLQQELLLTFKDSDDALLYEKITNYIDQHLANYLVIGFDLEGQAFVVAKNSTQKEDFALKALAHKFITQDWHKTKR